MPESLLEEVFDFYFFFQAEDGIRDIGMTGVQTCALPISILRPNPSFTVMRVLTNTSSSDYNALQAVYARRLTRGLQAHVAYTWSHSIDDEIGRASCRERV